MRPYAHAKKGYLRIKHFFWAITKKVQESNHNLLAFTNSLPECDRFLKLTRMKHLSEAPLPEYSQDIQNLKLHFQKPLLCICKTDTLEFQEFPCDGLIFQNSVTGKVTKVTRCFHNLYMHFCIFL